MIGCNVHLHDKLVEREGQRTFIYMLLNIKEHQKLTMTASMQYNYVGPFLFELGKPCGGHVVDIVYMAFVHLDKALY
jgi:hypothetical protein